MHLGVNFEGKSTSYSEYVIITPGTPAESRSAARQVVTSSTAICLTTHECGFGAAPIPQLDVHRMPERELQRRWKISTMALPDGDARRAQLTCRPRPYETRTYQRTKRRQPGA